MNEITNTRLREVSDYAKSLGMKPQVGSATYVQGPFVYFSTLGDTFYVEAHPDQFSVTFPDGLTLETDTARKAVDSIRTYMKDVINTYTSALGDS